MKTFIYLLAFLLLIAGCDIGNKNNINTLNTHERLNQSPLTVCKNVVVIGFHNWGHCWEGCYFRNGILVPISAYDKGVSICLRLNRTVIV